VATPGWYPDPSGTPGAFRYFDGQSWSEQTSDTPYAAPPGGDVPSPANPFDQPTVFPSPGSGPAPPPPPPPPSSAADVTSVAGTFQPYGQVPPGQPPQQGWQQPPSAPGWQQPGSPYGAPVPGPSGPSGGGSTGKAVGLGILAVVLVILLGVGTFFVVRAFQDDGGAEAGGGETSATDSPSTDTSEPTEDPSTEGGEPTEEPTSEEPDPEPEPAEPVDPFTDPGTPTAQQCTGGTPGQGVTGFVGDQQTGGGLTMPRVAGFAKGPDQSAAFEFADGVTAPSRVIEQNDQAGWVAVYALGGLAKANGFESPGQAAGVVLECMATSETFYDGFTGGTLVASRQTTIDGNDAWVMVADIRVDNPNLTVEGDVATVVVVDTGDPQRYGLFVSVVPIGNAKLIAQQRQQEGLIAVE
jgi:hypothetical protein